MSAGPFGNLPRQVRVRDMTLRDGLQSLPQVLPLAAKLELYDALAAANVTDFQVTSFMNPARVPQLADAEAMWRALVGRPGRRDVLIANPRGLDRAIASIKGLSAGACASRLREVSTSIDVRSASSRAIFGLRRPSADSRMLAMRSRSAASKVFAVRPLLDTR